MQDSLSQVQKDTGNLYGNLFSAYDQENFLKSIELFERRMNLFGLNADFFKGKRCLDIGCGGGRASIALATFGAEECIGVDVSESGVEDARKRADFMGLNNVQFQVTSGDNLPFENGSFDFVLLNGVLMHMDNPEKGMEELSRVTKKGGTTYMLVYATGGVRWPLVTVLRPLAQKIGFPLVDQALQASGLDVKKRRTYLDDLYVPCIDFYTWDRLTRLLEKNGFTDITRFPNGRFDHEESLEDYRKDLSGFPQVFKGAENLDIESESTKDLFRSCAEISESVVKCVDRIIESVERGDITNDEGMQLAIGQGHHRLTARKV